MCLHSLVCLVVRSVRLRVAAPDSISPLSMPSSITLFPLCSWLSPKQRCNGRRSRHGSNRGGILALWPRALRQVQEFQGTQAWLQADEVEAFQGPQVWVQGPQVEEEVEIERGAHCNNGGGAQGRWAWERRRAADSPSRTRRADSGAQSRRKWVVHSWWWVGICRRSVACMDKQQHTGQGVIRLGAIGRKGGRLSWLLLALLLAALRPLDSLMACPLASTLPKLPVPAPAKGVPHVQNPRNPQPFC